MGGLTGAVHWWEEWQLRVLVLCSLAIQCLLFIFSFMRRYAIPGLIRFMTWLVYLAGDAVAIYALATLFNRHKTDEHGGRTLEVVWVPVLLLHLGGHDGFTAYNIEDNELWSRHLVTAVSQVTVAIYVFCKSWPPGGDKRLLQAAILLFIAGVVKCFMKPWALKRASIYSLVSSSPADVKQNEGEMYRLEEYVKQAKDFVREQKDDGEAQGVRASMEHEDRPRCNKEPGGTVIGELMEDVRGARVALTGTVKGKLVGGTVIVELMEADEGVPSQGSFFGRLRERPREILRQMLRERQRIQHQVDERVREMLQGRSEASKLFVDLSSSYPRRLSILEDFWGLREERAYGCVRQGLATASLLLYTKLKTAGWMAIDSGPDDIGLDSFCRKCIQLLRVVLPWASIGLFHWSHREAQNEMGEAGEEWPEMVAQCSFIGYYARNRKHSKKMCTVSCLGCKDFVDQHWCMKSACFSSARISELVLRYLKDGWREKIKDATSYHRFNNHRSSEGLNLSTNRNRPLLFDESVLLWHIATDFCFFSSSFSEHRCAFAKVPMWTECGQELTCCKAVLCRQMSNYMAYLLFVNPEMLLPGSRRNLFTTSHQELQGIFKGDNQPSLDKMRELSAKIISKLESSSQATTSGTFEFIHEAWTLAQKLQSLGNEKKMWEVIQGVWVEMLCYSAGRCRGYLHAKALGKGGEFLSYVWLLLFHMGMETFTDKLQREQELPSHEAGSNDMAEPTREVSTTTTSMDRLQREHLLPSQGGNQYGTPSTSEICEVAGYEV